MTATPQSSTEHIRKPNDQPLQPDTATLPRHPLLLLAVTALIAVLFDRIVVATFLSLYTPDFHDTFPHMTVALAIFWFVCLVVVTALHWHTAKRNPYAWFTTAAITLLVIWMIVAEHSIRAANGPTEDGSVIANPMLGFDIASTDDFPFLGNNEYQLLTLTIAVPSLLMLHAQLVGGLFSPSHPFGLALRWLTGWIIQPFNRLDTFGMALAKAINTAAAHGKRPVLRKIGIAILICVPMIGVLLALLASADMVFAYGLSSVFHDFDVNAILFHSTIILVPIPFLYSLLVNLVPQDSRDTSVRTNSTKSTGSSDTADSSNDLRALYSFNVRLALDPTITMIVLGAALIVYAVFCSVQFTFLFAGAGLPDGLTYAEYARSGFFQLLFVAAVNLAAFGLVLTYVRNGGETHAAQSGHGTQRRALIVMLIGLIAATAVLLASAATRLGLYIGAYGLTWLRFTAMSFIALLAVVLVLCLAKMRFSRIPLITVCCILFVLWYIALGYADPAALIQRYNLAHGFITALPLQ
ncbi:hypothetical protein EP30_06750 [Bifidobacterium sp. UTCIF-39]|uniref:DUF4153 domain-containing protein n=1 Tax=Bifidobacterium sp. UTCIF-39 TaxID=1465359 RepID=UPI0011296FB6|nr:DUF4173 domain-containing protein [Bifidobacterium sp. UTCIF-39]TPF96573.1 hypothetical protein EP30_06750 [Bifidobacterium sp. UTCIF-39]